ncbi:hypothetical protein GJ744_008543 [Endocarpon pusillum]|uniref:Uncharacterized protein n=1 Tax=Endocarpon pusillum TaxID=364733 RepID=A0A8H7AL63_9EURO|nr:hypothetical protein GJ744_008543 [Endocarpon pusillum]
MDFETPGTPSQPVPVPAEDENIVNAALITFLQAIWTLDAAHDTRWTNRRKAFKFVPTDVKGKASQQLLMATCGFPLVSFETNLQQSERSRQLVATGKTKAGTEYTCRRVHIWLSG